MRRILATLILLTTVLAGCSDGGGPDCDGYLEDGECIQIAPPSAEKGVLRGIVVDAAIVPVAGMHVTVLQGTDVAAETDTDEGGTWVVQDLDPGFYRIRFDKAGYDTIEIQASVEAGQVSPVLKVQAERQAGFQPFYNEFQWDGFFQCAAGVQDPVVIGNLVAANLCFIANAYSGLEISQDDSFHLWYDEFIDEAEHPQYTQVETVWESTQTVSNSLNIRYETSVPGTTSITHVFGSKQGPSPQKYAINSTMAMAGGLGAATTEIDEPQGLAVEFFPGYDDLNPVGFALEQRFTTFVFAFYDYEPPEDWSFVETGEVPAPAA